MYFLKKHFRVLLIGFALILFIMLNGCETSPSLIFEDGGKIYKMQEDGSEKTKLLNDGKFPRWIPKTKDKFAFVRFKGPKAAIFIADEDGKNVKQLTQYNASEYYSWSPDRNWIVFETDRHGKWQIYKINVNTKKEHRLTQNNQFNDRRPRWAPDETVKKIAFESDRRNGDWDIWIMDENGGSLQNLTNGVIGDGYDGHAVWSPNAQYIACLGNHIGWGGIKIYRIYLTSPISYGPFSQYEASGGTEPLWSPSGDFIFYVGYGPSNYIIYKQLLNSNKSVAISSTFYLPAGEYMDANEVNLIYAKQPTSTSSIYLYRIKWRIKGEAKIGDGFNPDVW